MARWVRACKAGPAHKLRTPYPPARRVRMRINTRGRWRPDRRQTSKGQRMPGNCALNKSNRRTSGGGNTAAAIERVDIDDLQPWGKNARVHSPKQVRQLARGIDKL